MKKHAATIVLVVLAFALGLWLWLDRDRVTQGERKRRENSVFVAWRREELTQIRLQHDGETIVLERDARGASSEGKEGLWRMTSPRAERADPVAVERLLTTLEFATVARKVAESAPSLGLDAPRASGAVQMGGLTTSFVLGGESPRPEGSGYFRVGDGAPIVVSKELVTALLEPSDTYRDRTVVPYLASELSRFEVTREGGGFALERIDERSFRLAGDGLLASRTAVERLWAALAEMRAEAFPKDADADRLTAHPVVTVKLTPKDDKRPAAELVIGEACPAHPADVVVLRKTPTRAVACAPKDVVVALAGDAMALVEKHPFTLHMDEVEELRLERIAPPLAVEIARKGTGFHARSPFDRDLTAPEADAANALVTSITLGEATSVTRGGGAAFVAFARATIHLGESKQVVEIGTPRADGRATLRRVVDDARLEADAGLVRKLVPRETSLRPRAVLVGEPRRVSRVVLRCGTEQELVDRGEGFRFVVPAGYEADGSIAQLVDAVTKGHADAWVADADDGTFGFARDACRVVFGFEDGNAPVTLTFGGEGEGGAYAKLEGVTGRAGVMVMPKGWRELAGRIYVSRGALRTEASRIDHVRVTAFGKPVTPSDANALRDAAAGLYADRVVALHAKPRAPADVTIEIGLADGGVPKHVSCASPKAKDETAWVCTVDGVDATFAVLPGKMAAFLGVRDAAAP